MLVCTTGMNMLPPSAYAIAIAARIVRVPSGLYLLRGIEMCHTNPSIYPWFWVHIHLSQIYAPE